jgi:dephospho-CoA kinase
MLEIRRPVARKTMAVLIGLTGGYCAGKNLVGSILEKRGFLVIDVDKLGHAALTEAKAEVAEVFGPEALTEGGEVDRRALGRRVFGDPEALARLEGIVHPIAIRMNDDIVAKNPAKTIVVNAALLYRMPIAARCDFILVVKSPLILRAVRGMKRDRLSLAQVLSRMARQRTLRPQRSLEFVDRYTIGNSGNPARLAARVEIILARKGL